ncbi:hypothetical protein KEM52_006247 [Ascosphaera acerosa]|nr:hypothetical protein KEM52_006247 [Ascosphaera acerosa]
MKWPLLKALLQRAPLLTRVYILSLLSLSPTRGRQDVRTELVATLFRSFITLGIEPVGKTQRRSLRRFVPNSCMWISKVTVPKPPEDDVRVHLLNVVDALGSAQGGVPSTYISPDLVPVEAEWVGHRAGVDPKEPLPDVSDAELYRRLMSEVKEDVTVLYLHGGAY